MSEARRLAALHAGAVDEPWDEAAFAALLARDGAICEAGADAFALVQVAADEAELLMLATRRGARRRGAARAVLTGALDRAGAAGARRCWLEVAADNEAAVALYRRLDFASSGKRAGYYARDGNRVDALVMVKELGAVS